MAESEGFVRYVRKTGTSMGVSIPLEVIRLLRIRENDIVRVTVEKIRGGGKDKN